MEIVSRTKLSLEDKELITALTERIIVPYITLQQGLGAAVDHSLSSAAREAKRHERKKGSSLIVRNRLGKETFSLVGYGRVA